ncbi:peptidylprolyl isomerase [Lacimicrobium alkaliphilum]|uniref:Peptidyl-prolyl cis-trans isomerase n=1 Tax=Lacimicrobium alkaliphilum TaxID=1526571 RepID=A0ABQ1QXF2_9ALTE|nr:peptidylprolyl isomerase [Lacimicrobium alkaliphilum]GGD48731.1 peptidyl-prolyl cis-trans isomerase [Lacimicrobium alkaliphilum]
MRVWVAIFMTLASLSVAAKNEGAKIQPDNLFPKVRLETSMGEIVVELDRIKAPITSNNFLLYVSKRSYEDTIFHRVIEDFVVQGGGYDTEFNSKPTIRTIFNESGNGNKNELYTLAMARENDPHSAGRQFFFNMNDNESLDPGRKWGYAVFGRVTEGMEVLDKIAAVETQVDPTFGWPNVPVEPVILKKATILPPQF